MILASSFIFAKEPESDTHFLVFISYIILSKVPIDQIYGLYFFNTWNGNKIVAIV